jgi:hypothetical protein
MNPLMPLARESGPDELITKLDTWVNIVPAGMLNIAGIAGAAPTTEDVPRPAVRAASMNRPMAQDLHAESRK